MQLVDISVEARSNLHAGVVLSHAKLLDALIIIDLMIPTSSLSRHSRLILRIKHSTSLMFHHIVFGVYMISTLSNPIAYVGISVYVTVYEWKALFVSGGHGSFLLSVVALWEEHFVALKVHVEF